MPISLVVLALSSLPKANPSVCRVRFIRLVFRAKEASFQKIIPQTSAERILDYKKAADQNQQSQ
jgi:hypothetical protein